MNILSRLRLRTKLALLLGLFCLGLVASMGLGASTLYTSMLNQRLDKLRATVEMAQSLAGALEKQVSAGKLSRDQQLTQLRDVLHTMRFDDGDGYMTLLGLDGTTLLHGVDPAREGKASTTKDANGQSIIELIRGALRNDASNGSIGYMFPRPGQTQPQPKVAYVGRFTPLNAAFLSGAYTDDLVAEYRAQLVRTMAIGGGILLVTLVTAWLIDRDITRSLHGLKNVMARLAGGEMADAIVGTDRRDEVGEMARAVAVFKEHMLKATQLAAEQETERDRAEQEKQGALLKMAETIEQETATALDQIGGRAAAMTADAENMAASANRTGAASGEAAASAAQALANAQTVASAAEELAASIREIGGQVSQSTAVVSRAVEAGIQTRATIEALNEKVGRIGAVADMISEIAAKTNLLALNATIEAARAGDAGKGFAVVASEVKQLATQTAKSTDEISRHIAEVKAATTESVAQVAHIESTITEINAIAGSIAAAVEEQGAATAEIARNVAETANAANEMTRRTQDVSGEAERTGSQASSVLENINGLKAAVVELKGSVIRVVRTSTSAVDRRKSERHAVDLRGRITVAGGGTHDVRIVDVSDGGVSVKGAPSLPLRSAGRITLEGLSEALAFTALATDAKGIARLIFDQRGSAALRPLLNRLAAA
ncbi:MAG: methyl-accepting chemotaxis protein [Acetobacteraceae bacterium]